MPMNRPAVLEAIPPPVLPVSPSDPDGTVRSDGSARLVVVAERDLAHRRFIAHTLRASGTHVLEAIDGIDVLNIVRAWYHLGRREPPIDAIIADELLSRVGALDVLDTMRAASIDIPLVLMSSNRQPQPAPGHDRRGVTLLDRPFTAEQLREAVQRATLRPAD